VLVCSASLRTSSLADSSFSRFPSAMSLPLPFLAAFAPG